MHQIDQIQQKGTYQTINDLTKLFNQQIQKCLESVRQLVNFYPKNVIILEIKAACQSLAGNFQKALEDWRKCLELSPNNPAYQNNLAWICMKTKEYLEAVTYLNGIKNQWAHPSIYWNLAVTYEKGGAQDFKLIQDAMEKQQQYKKHYPNYEAHKGLILLFLLDQKQKYSSSIPEFKKQIIEMRNSLQNFVIEPFTNQKINKLCANLQKILQKGAYRKQQEQLYGIFLQKQVKAYLHAIQQFHDIILANYNPQFAQRLNVYVVQGLRKINEAVFTLVINDQIDFKTLENHVLQPLRNTLIETRDNMIKFIGDLKKNDVIKGEQCLKIDRYQRSQINMDSNDYQFKNRYQSIQKILIEQHEGIIQILRVEKQQTANPLFVYVHYRRLHFPVFEVYLNLNLIKNNFAKFQISPQLSEQISSLSIQKQIQVRKYFHALNLLLRFYNYFGQNNFYYQFNGKQHELALNHFIEIITPILNQIPQDDAGRNIGWICNEVHFNIVKYISQTTNVQKYTKFIRKLLKNINLMVSRQTQQGVSSVNQLFLDILTSKKSQYLNDLLEKQLIQIDGKGNTKAHEYFFWKMNQHHVIHREKTYRQLFSEHDRWIIANLSSLFINIVQISEQNLDSVIDLFLDCYYCSRQQQAQRKKIMRKFYEVNHQISSLQKMSKAFTRFFKKLIP